MLFMTQFSKGDIVLVPFPFSDQPTVKKRPAVICSSDPHNEISPDVIIMAITGQTKGVIGIGEFLMKDWQSAGLVKPSAVKSSISTIEQRLVLKKLGRLSHQDLSALEKALKELFDLR
jgi:mRNA interferase MazF